MEIFKIKNKKEEKFLKRKVRSFSFSKYEKKDLRKLIQSMRVIMKKADGIGLSANQVGIDESFFIAEVNGKFYSVFNPKLSRLSKEAEETEEGCLSVPNVFGLTKRPAKVTLEGFDINNKKVKIKAWGLLSRVFQHEVDHLKGVLFTEKAKDTHETKI